MHQKIKPIRTSAVKAVKPSTTPRIVEVLLLELDDCEFELSAETVEVGLCSAFLVVTAASVVCAVVFDDDRCVDFVDDRCVDLVDDFLVDLVDECWVDLVDVR